MRGREVRSEFGYGAEESETPLVSVVVTAYNSWPLVGEAIESVLKQWQGNTELVVVDDGSTDGTRERLEAAYPRVSVISQENQERGAARNRGLRNANGRFVVFLDADDLLEPWYIGQFIEKWLAQGRANAIYVCPALRWTPATGGLSVLRLPREPNEELLRRALRGTIWGVSCAIAPREKVIDVGGFPEERAAAGSEDWVFQVKLIASGTPVEVLPHAAVRVREHAGRSTNESRARERGRQVALQLLVDSGIAGRDLYPHEQALAIAGTHRFCAAHAYRSGRMREARQHLREVRHQIGQKKGWKWSGRLWLQTWCGKRGSTIARRLRSRIAAGFLENWPVV